ncbi:DUF4912 domain-containing protein [Paenibacillus chondroitinus]|uniref:DUF4912 domain-containing protein n=1 Tax=Paenibacillus chondroitinus TaxID=59842 RepID=A0ABU6DNF5_9BACL|nr:DUF4912 domain-containing protein [Paenibacillus chondroitinus]MEB4799268.1 DUF4912 domain-containing protein [Paenibacillus chondroitinus]
MSLIPTQAFSAHSNDRDTLHLLVQSSANLFAYWQLSSRKKRMVQDHFGADWLLLQPTLRFYETTVEQAVSTPLSDTISELPLPQGECCFLNGFLPGRLYLAELGIKNEQGQFLPLLRSNTIQTPHIHTNQEFPSNAATLENQVTYRPAAVSIQLKALIAHEYFSAYSVYLPKCTPPADSEFGGDLN